MAIDTVDRMSVMDITDDEPPNPGSDEAVKLGCKCPVLDNHYGKGFPGRNGETLWWRNADCAMHTRYAGARSVRVHSGLPDPEEKRPVLMRVYYSDNYGRRSKQTKLDYHHWAIQTLRYELAFGGRVELPEARAWGKVIMAVGREGTVMTVHLGKRAIHA